MKWLMRILGKGKKSKRGFTLIELMFVVIVIAILAAAGIAMYLRSLDKARASEGLAILSSVRTHYLVEYAEHGYGPPSGTTTTGGTDLDGLWGIDTSMNKWWIEANGFETDWDSYASDGTTPVVILEGTSGDPELDKIMLSIDCKSGEIVQNYNWAYP